MYYLVLVLFTAAISRNCVVSLETSYLRTGDMKTRTWYAKFVQVGRSEGGGKYISAQIGLTYIGRSVSTQGIQEKWNFDFTMYGYKVIGQNVKCPIIAPP